MPPSPTAFPTRRTRPAPWLLDQVMAPSSKHTPQGCLTSPDLSTQSSNWPVPATAPSLLCWPLSFQVPAYPKIWTPILAAARTCTLSASMSYLCYTCLRRRDLFSCVHGPKSTPLSWLLLCFTACTCALSLLCHVSALKVWEAEIALAVVAGGTRQRRLNTLWLFNIAMV